MKFKMLPVILTAAVTSVMTLFVAAHYQHQLPYFTTSSHANVPVNYASYNSNDNGSNMSGPVNFESAAASSVKAVVHINTIIKARTVVADDDDGGGLFGDMFGRQQYYIPEEKGSGSGVVISPDGYIVTNNHVVAGANQVTVTFNDRYTTQAKVIAADPATDIAVVKVDEKNLPFMEFGNSDDVKLGQWVLAVGYPLSLDATVTAGIVSAKSRSIGINRTQSASAIESFIQTDAAVNPGNSGGALVNTAGQLIGINSAIASPTGSYAGYSYAIPSNIVRKAVNDLIQYGSVKRGYIGIEMIDRKSLTQDQINELGMDKTDGVYVKDVLQGSGAAKAGIKSGDFITAVNNEPVHTQPELMGQVARYHPGDNISLSYVHSGKTYTTNVKLENLNGTTAIATDETDASIFGARFRTLSSRELGKYRLKGGVLVTDIGNGPLAKTNMRKGFVIVTVNDAVVGNVDDLQKAMADNGGSLQIGGFYPGYQGMYYYGLNSDGSSRDE